VVLAKSVTTAHAVLAILMAEKEVLQCYFLNENPALGILIMSCVRVEATLVNAQYKE
jgi:hypothetical protein